MEQRSRSSVRSSVTQSRAEQSIGEHSTAHLTHLERKGSPFVTHTRVQDLAHGVRERARSALLFGGWVA